MSLPATVPMSEINDDDEKMKGKKGGARGGLECDIDILRGVKAKIIMKGKQGGAKGGFKYDVVILCNVVKESERKVFRDRARGADRDSKWDFLKDTQKDELRKVHYLRRSSNARTLLNEIAGRVIKILGLDEAYQPERGSILKTFPGAAAQKYHLGEFHLLSENCFHSSISFSRAYVDTVRRRLILIIMVSTLAVDGYM